MSEILRTMASRNEACLQKPNPDMLCRTSCGCQAGVDIAALLESMGSAFFCVAKASHQ